MLLLDGTDHQNCC